ncbi:hypothetical protein GCM10029963_68930 [Micromonospora andamanensis]
MSDETNTPAAPKIPAQPGPARTLLEVDNVTLRFGGVVALNEVKFEIRKARSSA